MFLKGMSIGMFLDGMSVCMFPKGMSIGMFLDGMSVCMFLKCMILGMFLASMSVCIFLNVFSLIYPIKVTSTTDLIGKSRDMLYTQTEYSATLHHPQA